MCGIFCAIGREAPLKPSPELQKLLQQRGPDSHGKREDSIKGQQDNSTPLYVTFHSTVLSMRGDAAIIQPYQDGLSASTLCWNGEAWSIATVATHGNDTEQVFNLLSHACQHAVDATSREIEARMRLDAISKALSTIAGPYAFVFHDARSQMLFFGRDFLGRRSLLLRVTEGGDVLISSVTDPSSSNAWAEVEADDVYGLDLLASTVHPSLVIYQTSHVFHEDGVSTQSSVVPRLVLSHRTPVPDDALNCDAMPVVDLERLLRSALAQRILNIPDPPGATALTESPARLAVLFSGGLDCTALARLSHDILPGSESIDLLNVAFENPRIHKPARPDDQSLYELCPDRVTGRSSFNELRRICPERTWRFVAINVPYTTTMNHRANVIQLMHPHNTEMDLSISFALYFAARGEGVLEDDRHMPYTTTARVLLSGLGADELFGGYQRHATAFGRHGLEGLLAELDLDIGRLGKRNLGRDDRVISHWGREARFPFLDEQVVSWALSVPISSKCDFTQSILDSGGHDSCENLESGKKVLRCLAWKLGMRKVAKEKKRAVSPAPA